MEYMLIFNFDKILHRMILTVDKEVFNGVLYEVSKVYPLCKETLELFDLERYYIVVGSVEIDLGFINLNP